MCLLLGNSCADSDRGRWIIARCDRRTCSDNTLLVTHPNGLLALGPVSASEQQNTAAASGSVLEPVYHTQVLAGQVTTDFRSGIEGHDGIGQAARFTYLVGMCVGARACDVCVRPRIDSPRCATR
jgi:hypothetical protein